MNQGLATRRKDCWAPLTGTCTVVTLPEVTGVCVTADQEAPEPRTGVDCNWSRAAEPGQEITTFVPARLAVKWTGPGTVNSWVIRVDQADELDGYV